MPESRTRGQGLAKCRSPWLPPLALKGRGDHWHRPPDCARGGHAVLVVLPAALISLKFAAPSLSTMSGAPPPPPAAWSPGNRSGIVGRLRVAHVVGQHGAGIVVRPCAGSARPFASSCGDGPCSSSAKRTESTRTRTRHHLQECAGPRPMVSCDGVVSFSGSLTAHAVRGLPAAEDPAGQVQRLRDRFGRTPCRPARDSRKNASCSPRKSTSARRPSGPFRAGRRACSSSTCGRGIGARGRFSALPPARTPMTRPPQGAQSAARIVADIIF